MKNNFTYENTKDATHYAANNSGGVNFYRLDDKSSFIMNRSTDFEWEELNPALKLTSLTDQTDRGYPTLKWFLGCGFKLEAGDLCIDSSGTEKEILTNSIARMWHVAPAASDIYVKSLHDNRHDLTMMARDEYYAKRAENAEIKTETPEETEVFYAIEKKQWPNNERIDAIGQNGNNGEHYPHESESPLSPNFESKPAYTQEMHDRGELPPVGSECLCVFEASEWRGKVVKVYSHDVNSNDNVVLAGAQISSGGVTAVEFHQKFLKPIDTRTDEEKLRDELISELSSSYTRLTDIVKNKSRFAHYANDLIESEKFTITLNK